MSNIGIYFDPGNTAYKQIGDWQAQTFVVPAGTNYITKIRLKLRKVGSPGGNALCRIYTTSGNFPATNLGEATYLNSNVGGSGTYDWYEFTFAGNGVKVIPGTKYCVAFYSTSDTNNTCLWFASGSYWDGGSGSRISSGTWQDVSWDYSLDIDGQYISDVVAPTVTTASPATNILKTTATMSGNVTADGGATVTERGICYNTSTNPTIANSKVVTTGTIGSFSCSLAGLTAATTYHCRAYATNSIGTSYGAEVDLTTINDATVTTAVVGTSSLSTLLGGGEVTSSGGGTISERGLCYSSITANPTVQNDKKINALVTVSAWTDTITGLTPGTIYYIRAYVITNVGIYYGSVVIGTTSSAPNTSSPEIYATIDGNMNDGNIRYYTTADSENHYMVEQAGVLYIGDRNYLHQVESVEGVDVFSSFVVDIPKPYRVTSLAKSGTSILIGSKVNNNVNDACLFAWDGWSLSYNLDDNVKENGINSFIDCDNFLLASVGTNGNLYVYSDGKLKLYKTIPGEYSPTKTCIINPYAQANLMGLPLFGLSNINGNPTLQGIYSFGAKKADFPYVLNLEYPISQRDGNTLLLSGLQIGAIVTIGNDLFCSWMDGAGNVGIDKLDYDNKLESAFFETVLIAPDRSILGKFNKYEMCYKDLPIDTDIAISYKANHNPDWTSLKTVNDTDRHLIRSESMIEASTLRMRVDFEVDGNNAPELESLYIKLE